MKLTGNKGSIVLSGIMMMGVISLIAVPNLSGIRQRSQVSADKRIAEQIGKATRIWHTDVDRTGEREFPTVATKYEEIEDLTDTYISKGYTAKSFKYGNGYYYVKVFDDGDEKDYNNKVRVAIASNEYSADLLSENAKVDYDGRRAAWAYIEQ